MTEPTDAEIVAVMRDGYNCRYNDEQDHIDFARAVLAKWAAPPAVAGEHKPGCPALGGYGHGVEECCCGATPQPTQAQALDELVVLSEQAGLYEHDFPAKRGQAREPLTVGEKEAP